MLNTKKRFQKLSIDQKYDLKTDFDVPQGHLYTGNITRNAAKIESF